DYGWAGMITGTMLGTSVGTLQAISQKDRLDGAGESARITKGALYGLIGGTGLGIGIGFYDLSQGKTGVGGIILRDINRGGWLGLVIGAAAGAIKYIDSNEAKDLGSGLAWGYIGGSAAGLIFGFIEGPRIVSSLGLEFNSRVQFALFPDSKGNPVPGLQFSRRY
ncbi:MAG: hypothetical protein HY547_06575, partial [Elusimicrobia bacterium]|nr:hypothetical protein [Elusimicrobiota bacterium]